MIKKLLLLQREFTRVYPSETRLAINNMASTWLKSLSKNKFPVRFLEPFFSQTSVSITQEFLFYGELPNLMGRENIAAIDRIHPSYFKEKPEEFRFLDWQNYPSNFGYPSPSFVSLREAESTLDDYDAVLSSIHCGPDVRVLLQKAKRKGILVALVDTVDHEKAYVSEDVDLFRGFKKDEFDIYFKRDIPLRVDDRRLIPLSPVPVKIIPRAIEQIPWGQKENDLFFVGSFRPGVTREDRLQLCDLLKSRFSKAKILVNEPHISLEQHEQEINNTKILVSPSGRVWDSFRHTEYPMYSLPVLLPEPPCKTLQPYFEDGVNCIFYKTKIEGGTFVLEQEEALVEKINFYLTNELEARKLGNNLKRAVLEGHTTSKRAQYMLDTLNQWHTG